MPSPTSSDLDPQVLGRLRRLLEKPRPTLRQRYRIGELVRKLVPERLYGAEFRPKLAEAFGRHESGLFDARKVAHTYRWDEITALLARAEDKGFQMVWSHLTTLASLDQGQRERYEKRCIRHTWSARELRRQLKIDLEPRSRGGRRPRRQRDPKSALRQLIDAGESWVRLCEAVWSESNGPSVSLDAVRRKADELGVLLDDAVSTLSGVERAARRVKQVLRSVEPQPDPRGSRARSSRSSKRKGT